ncbi:D-alanyl-D-alanine carboxypeptidase family protein [Patescibacteria group bacterium]|nr:MAG: D-alanyl-D-alanine carboxypeptidase family protein [Patescibacteria group bacterium]
MDPETSPWKKLFLALLAVATVDILVYLGHQNYLLKQEKFSLEAELAKTRQTFASTTQDLVVNIDALKQLLTATNVDKINAEQDILKQRELVGAMDAEMDSLSSTLGIYTKIINTDKELLAKYSRVYFLNENYIPKNLTPIPSVYTYEPKKESSISTDVLPFLQKLLDDAKSEGLDIKILSAYRSFETQTKIKSSYTITYGSGANRFSADQGYSEHQLGTTIDFTTSKIGTNFNTFEKTAGYTWLTENAYKYGFILSYPKNNIYYISEPWHWRFVGKNLALWLRNENRSFYDIPQREINEYLLSIFDQ